jgi:hypothetical protein
MADPGQGALDDPAFGDDLEAGYVVALDDLQPPVPGLGHGCGHDRPLIPGIGENHLDEREGAAGSAQQFCRAVAILDIGGMHHDPHHSGRAYRHDVPLAAGDFLARIVALRVDRGPPFCAARALWLSITAALGLASRPACSRQLT